MVDLRKIYSHKNKELIQHTKQVMSGSNDSKVARVAAIFHDIGKMNPFFQEKIRGNKVTKYSNHSLLSMLVFLFYYNDNQKNIEEHYTFSELLEIMVIILKHHSNIPDLPHIISDLEYDRLVEVLEEFIEIPFSQFISLFLGENKTELKSRWDYDDIIKILIKLTKTIIEKNNTIDFFLSLKYNFSLLTLSDKIDASLYQTSKEDKEFFNTFSSKIYDFKNHFDCTFEINKIRSEIQSYSLQNLKESLKAGKKLFSITAPTGSGKTLLLLSLAGEIIHQKGELNIIYTLPFLSIIEQVEIICDDIFNNPKSVKRIDSSVKIEEYDKLIEKLDSDPSIVKDIINIEFAREIFDYSFIVTTFVRIFETFTTNKNSELLKFANFANSIIIIDEIQSLPPRLYGFFVVLLDYFSKKFNSYILLSSATMPNFDLPDNNYEHDLKSVFNLYEKPTELSDYRFFDNKLFNRYNIKKIEGQIDISTLKQDIVKKNNSVLVILNTISDTYDLYNEMINLKDNYDDIVLLNTRFTLNDRKQKLQRVKDHLKAERKVILITTMLIEAGVDIDFPVLYRDLCPIPNIVQSAGRCNRNGKLKKGEVIIFELYKEGKSRAELIYRGDDRFFLNYAREELNKTGLNENKLFKVQKKYFTTIKTNTIFGIHKSKLFKDGEIDFVKELQKLHFAKIGKFKLIEEKFYGEEKTYYVQQNNEDDNFSVLKSLTEKLKNIGFNDYNEKKYHSILLQNHISKMSEHIVKLRVSQDIILPLSNDIECCGINLITKEQYSSETGIVASVENSII